MNLMQRTSRGLFSIRRSLSQTQALEFHKKVCSSLLPACTTCSNQQNWPSLVKREKHTAPSMSMALEDLSTWQRMKWNMGLYGDLQVPRRKLYIAGYNLYVCCSDFVNFEEFIQEAGLPDTFSSWFQLLIVHMWLLNVKLSQIGLEGVILKDMAYKAMWHSVEVRLDTFKDLLGSEKKKYIQQFYNSMMLSIMYLDEGLIGSDKQLANALWISLYNMREDVDPQKLELMVAYVRKQVYFHDELKAEPIMFPGYLPFLPLHGDKLNKEKSENDYKSLSQTKLS